VRSFEMDTKAKRYYIVSETYIDAPVAAVYGVLVDAITDRIRVSSRNRATWSATRTDRASSTEGARLHRFLLQTVSARRAARRRARRRDHRDRDPGA
jgi:hypothetical protein